jgi:hypothetical protein
MTHSDLINCWPSLSAFAEDIGVDYGTAKAMRRRGSIPSGYWKHAVIGAASREIPGVTYEVLADLVAISREDAA